MRNISQKLKYPILGLVSAIALLVIWSFIEPRVLNIETETAKIPNLPPSWQGKQIGQISDFQIGLWGDNRGTARRSVAKLVEAKPAVVLITGDFIYKPGSNIKPEIETAVDIVRPLIEADIPTYAVLGNHDYGMSSRSASPQTEQAERLRTALESAGIKVLDNESVQLQLPDSDDTLYLVGIGSLWANRDDPEQALSDVPDSSPRITMMHNPDSFEKFPANSAPLAVAGHTHGGQLRVPGLPQWSWLRFTQKDQVYADGWAKGFGEPGNQLYVNTGIGMSIAPIRLFCPPELTFFTLQAD
ncbi:metallophosphoesterase [Nostoc flagelliforme FACHB-838]|uniref:Metallophosphoesterase n=1 Tax=Nostoc flagelliforme FACHB-838 TaxID=2692904 RepID=A0ABR8DU46_9NOSO|nr:metallophosphoesterase [Nostoc flagelliforme]MBD2532966.1 metallophosphoesterase [Nostoc flagelliforme FACHB-838]